MNWGKDEKNLSLSALFTAAILTMGLVSMGYSNFSFLLHQEAIAHSQHKNRQALK
jgi:hypothetical protein